MRPELDAIFKTLLASAAPNSLPSLQLASRSLAAKQIDRVRQAPMSPCILFSLVQMDGNTGIPSITGVTNHAPAQNPPSLPKSFAIQYITRTHHLAPLWHRHMSLLLRPPPPPWHRKTPPILQAILSAPWVSIYNFAPALQSCCNGTRCQSLTHITHYSKSALTRISRFPVAVACPTAYAYARPPISTRIPDLAR